MFKILHIPNYYAPHIGGIEQTANDCVNALRGEYQQRVFCFHHEKYDETGEIDGIEVVRAGCFTKIASQSLSTSYGRLLKKQFREFQPDIVVFHYPNPFAAHFLLPLLKKYPCKFILWWHLDITKQKILGKFFTGQTNRLLRRADRIVATSPNYIKGSPFLQKAKEKCAVIPCCVRNRILYGQSQESAERLRKKYEGKIILFAVGRHVPYKGLIYLVQASKYLDDRFVVLIGGEGPLTDSLKKSAESDRKIIFLGKISDEARNACFGACDIYCFPSVTKNEAFGIALAEAMSFQKPAVTFTVPGSGVNYVSLRNITGLEAENGNAKAFAEAILRLADDGELRRKYGVAARERVQKLFTEEIFSHNVRKLFQEIGGEIEGEKR